MTLSNSSQWLLVQRSLSSYQLPKVPPNTLTSKRTQLLSSLTVRNYTAFELVV